MGAAVQQMSLSFEAGLSARFRSIVECMAACVHGRGLNRVAPMVDTAPSHLSAQLSGDAGRRLPADTVEAYIEHTGDLTPIYYLLDKFCRDDKARQSEALSKLASLAEQIPALMAAAGLDRAQAKGRAR